MTAGASMLSRALLPVGGHGQRLLGASPVELLAQMMHEHPPCLFRHNDARRLSPLGLAFSFVHRPKCDAPQAKFERVNPLYAHGQRVGHIRFGDVLRDPRHTRLPLNRRLPRTGGASGSADSSPLQVRGLTMRNNAAGRFRSSQGYAGGGGLPQSHTVETRRPRCAGSLRLGQGEQASANRYARSPAVLTRLGLGPGG